MATVPSRYLGETSISREIQFQSFPDTMLLIVSGCRSLFIIIGFSQDLSKESVPKMCALKESVFTSSICKECSHKLCLKQKTEMSISVRISKYDFQHCRLIFPGKYFVKFPVNLLKPNPQSRASILSSVHLRAAPTIFSRGIFQIPFSSVSSGNGILLKELPKGEDHPQSKWTFLI